MIRRYEAAALELKAAASPLRLAILSCFADGRESPQEVFVVLQRHDPHLNLSLVSYHVRLLERAGMIREVDKVKVRGATKHIYNVTKEGKMMLTLVEKLCENAT